jgi:hypothetical protein
MKIARTVSAALKGVKSGWLYQAPLREFEPNLLPTRPISAKKFREGAIAVLTFQVIGFGFTALFFAALISGKQTSSR